jgi:glycosyltransferase involved in cell wall biosynthesis
MNNITLIIPTYRNPKYLDLCLRSAVENRENPETRILVVVDGFFEESREVLEKYDEVLYLDLDTNRGMQFALNAGVMQADTKYVFIINDDNVMPEKWDTRLMSVLEEFEEVGKDRFVLTVDQIEPTGPGMFNFHVKDLGQTVETFQYEEYLKYEREITFDLRKGEFLFGDGHIFPFVMMKRYYMACGGFDTFYNSPNVCDWDFFLKLELLGFTFPRMRRLKLYHFGSVATKKNAESQKFREREAAAFAEFDWKWGFQPYNHPQSNSKIPMDPLPRGLGG